MIDTKITELLPNKPLLPVETVADFFQVNKRTIYNWYNANKLTGCNVAGVLRIYRQSVIALIESSTGRKNSSESNEQIERKIQEQHRKPVPPHRQKSGWIKNWQT